MKQTMILALGSLTIAAPAAAHVVVSPQLADEGAYVVANFRVGHGCDGRATTQLRVEIPAGIESVKTHDLQGWRIATETAGDKITAVIWTGRLTDDQFEQFEILIKLPAVAGPVYFPVTQVCGDMRTLWTETPRPGGAALSYPAPRIDVGGETMDGMSMDDMAEHNH